MARHVKLSGLDQSLPATVTGPTVLWNTSLREDAVHLHVTPLCSLRRSLSAMTARLEIRVDVIPLFSEDEELLFFLDVFIFEFLVE
jgi:hypothetical protein